jgi:hypothetical protein
METEQALMRIDGAAIISGEVAPGRYADDLARAAAAADQASRSDAFAEYHAEQMEKTRATQQAALACFSTYLTAADVQRQVSALYGDAEACHMDCSKAFASGCSNRSTASARSTPAWPSCASTAV